MEGRFREIGHTADLAIHVRGEDLAGLFANAAYGMARQLADLETLGCPVVASFELEAIDAEALLVRFLNDLLYRYEESGVVFHQFGVLDVSETRLRAEARGGLHGARRSYIKAATFSDLSIHRHAGWLETTIVFDV